jgi:hypothetical protein
MNHSCGAPPLAGATESGSGRGDVNSNPSLVAVASKPSRESSPPARASSVSNDAGVVKLTLSSPTMACPRLQAAARTAREMIARRRMNSSRDGT